MHVLSPPRVIAVSMLFFDCSHLFNSHFGHRRPQPFENMTSTTSPKPPIPPLSELPTVFPDTTCLRRGLCPVTSLRAQGPALLESHSLYYEQHGPAGVKGDDEAMKKLNKIVFIMGLNSSCFSWGPQVRYFGKGGEGGNCTALVFDNRGVGNSGYPRGPYT